MAEYWDVVVVGGGNAGYAAAISAKQAGAGSVLLIEKSPETLYPGGNSFFTAGAFRTVFHGLDDLRPIVHNVDAETAQLIDMEPYTREQFYGDLMRVTDGRADPALGRVLVDESRSTIEWLHRHVGIRFQLSFHRQAYKVDGRFKFWGGMVLSTVEGGRGLMGQYQEAARQCGVSVRYGTALTHILSHERTSAVSGIQVLSSDDGTKHVISTGALVLTCGGFEANPAMRAQYLGPGWDTAHVRGTPYNTGDGLLIAQRDCQAKPAGGWSSCHATCWDANTDPHKGNVTLTNQFTKSGYPLGIMVNANGNRFVDEGLDFRNYTYAFFGKEIMRQPGSIAYQIWDSKVLDWLRKEEYSDDVVEKVYADSIEELAAKLAPIDKDQLIKTVCEYNDAVRAHRREHPQCKWDPAVKDRLSTQSSALQLAVPKSNWALTIDQDPFVAVKVTTGITFTFGGLAVDPATATVLDTSGNKIRNLFASGEIVGGAFYSNYPGGSGLMLGAILGRKAGISAAKQTNSKL